MKRLFSGVAMAALVAVAASAWAQTPTVPPAQNTPAANAPATMQAPAASQNTKSMSEKVPATAVKKQTAIATEKKGKIAAAPRMHRSARYAQHMTRHRMHRGWHAQYAMHSGHRGYGWGRVHGPTDFMARQLNQQELGQIQTGGGMPMPAQPSSPSGY